MTAIVKKNLFKVAILVALVFSLGGCTSVPQISVKER